MIPTDWPEDDDSFEGPEAVYAILISLVFAAFIVGMAVGCLP